MPESQPSSAKRPFWPDKINPLDWTPLQWLFTAGIAATFFLIFPETDLWVSGGFFDALCGGWEWKKFWLFQLTYKGLPILTGAIVIGAILLYIWGEYEGRAIWNVTRRTLVYILLVIALGPGLFANTFLKDNWGRARPASVEEFGGSKTFSPPLVMSDQCERNCSFVSGHASMGFAMLMFGFLTRDPVRRRKVFMYTFAFGVIVGLGRIGQGRHFFSDTIFAFYLVFGVSWLLAKGILKPGWLDWAWLDGGNIKDDSRV